MLGRRRGAGRVAGGPVAVVALVATLTACVAPVPAQAPLAPLTPLTMLNAFDPGEATYIHLDGANSVRGQAFLRQSGGGVVTCAGAKVHLFPRTTYGDERVEKLYGTRASIEATQRIIGVVIEDPDPRWVGHMRQTICDAEGRFMFTGVADGAYYVETEVRWSVGYRPQGGPVIAPVTVDGGEAVDLIVAP